MVSCNSSNVRNALVLTTLFWVLIRVVSTVILTITHPAQWFTKGVVALELILGAVSTSWNKAASAQSSSVLDADILRISFVRNSQWWYDDACLLPPLSQLSSSLPSMQSGSSSQRQRRGMQWPFLHWNWSRSHFTSQPFWKEKKWIAFIIARQILNQKVPSEVKMWAIPHLSHQRSHGPRHTSSALQCNARLCRKTRSRSTGEALRTQGQALRMGVSMIKEQGESKQGARRGVRKGK